MKAKIFDVVDVDSIPSELQNRLERIDDLIKSTCLLNTTSRYMLNLDTTKPANLKCCLESIATNRLQLAEIDKALGNCSELLQGYHDFVEKKASDDEQSQLVQKALESQQMQHEMDHHHDHANCDIAHEAPQQPMTKELIQKIAEMSDVD